ncbi:AraC family transcriptional regulator [Paenibacillus nasutitermitis]|uniref:HTH araC/xylS-type domain-containing protein n=1 Tax=Paenibacillus nasutitermitis TaxID=1652958 RepID=A0A916Z2Y9_9BACL|nr:AraC family transcriptional regulator [Paenibacillus nasutitermitis]GGD73548.1 hypothetical protein GCM10010911_34280 [Paenibacillus nasutitermitis]
MRGFPIRGSLKRHRLFVRLLIPYLLFMLLALLLGLLLYNKTYDAMKNEVTRNNLELLDQVKDTMDRRLSEINTIAMQVLSDPQVKGFQRVTDPFDGSTTFKVMETQKRLYTYNVSNNFVLDYFLLFKNSDLALSPKTTYQLPRFYRSAFTYTDKDYETWRSEMFGTFHAQTFQPAEDVTYQGKSYSMLTYVQSLGYPGHIQGALAILVDNRQVQSLLGGLNLSDGGWASIVNNKGQVISFVSADGKRPRTEAIDYKLSRGIINASDKTDNMLITYTNSTYNDWSYVVAQPPHVVLQKVLYIKKITFAIVFAFLFAGLLLAYLFAYRSSRPLLGIVKTISERFGAENNRPGDMYGFIHNSVSRLIDNNLELQGEIEKQAPLLWETFFERLLKGEFLTMNEINSLLRHQRMEISGRGYAIGIVHFPGMETDLNADLLHKLDVSRVIIKEILRARLGQYGYLHDVAEDKIAVLFVNPVEERESFKSTIEDIVRKVQEDVRAKLPIIPAVAVGSFSDSLLDVSSSYEEARQSLYYTNLEHGGGLVWYDELPNESSGFYFPGEVETRLINYVKAGETAEVDKLLSMLHRENFLERHLSFAMQQLFLCEVLGSLVKVQDQLLLYNQGDVKMLFQQLYSSDKPALVYRLVMDKFKGICQEIDQKKKSRNVRLVESIIELLGQRYSEPNLNLDSVADQMNTSKVYLSQFFKEQTGTNFSEYLENLRMERAKDLLTQTSQAIGDIALQVGYHSTNTFSRAFKRGTGVSATTYRDTELSAKTSAS